ncbi:MAG: type IV secretion system DNA-binding domain-containing protein [bacterium]|nr:type IV secretion system DNA-binding domain-containing protein [bacterium]
MSNNSITIFAATNFRNSRQKFGIKQDDRRRHMYLIGKTGMGKSVLQENMIIHDIQSGHGVAVVDPHGDLVEKVIKYIPSNRINDVIYFNPSDTAHPIAFNVVERVEPEYRHLVASGLIGIFQKLWADSWGPRLEYILRNAILAILDYPGSTLMAVTRMLSDKPFRKKVIEKIQDPVVKAFWVNEFASYADKFASEAVSPIQNKVGQFLSSSLIRNIVGQVQSSLNIRQIMDESKILLMNLSKGHIGEDNSALLGAMMITKIQLAAMSRVDTPEDERVDFYLYVDEFQNFATSSFANILSEARKYRLNLIMAHQYIAQLTIGENSSVWPAVQGNVGTLVVFRVGAADAEELVKEFDPQYIESDLVNLPKYNFYIKLMIDGVASHPFSAIGLPPKTVAEETHNVEKVIAVSRERYSGNREVVEEKIMRWHGMTDDAEKEPEPERDFKKKSNFQGQKSFSEQKFAPRNNFSLPEPVRVNSSGGQLFNQRDDSRQLQSKQDDWRSEQKDFHNRPKKVVQPQGHIAKRYYNTDNDDQLKKSVEPENNNFHKESAGEDSGISLADAISQGTVDFKGKKIEKKDEIHLNNQIENKPVIDKNQNLDKNRVQNGKIKMGEKVRINNNKKY